MKGASENPDDTLNIMTKCSVSEIKYSLAIIRTKQKFGLRFLVTISDCIV